MSNEEQAVEGCSGVLGRLKHVGFSSPAAALIAVDLLDTRTSRDRELASAVSQACRVVVHCFMIMEKNVGGTVVEVIDAMSRYGERTGRQPALMMLWALQGVALAVAGRPESMDAVETALAEVYPQLPAYFREYCLKAGRLS